MPVRAQIGKVINGYELIEFITDGGNAWCWLAKNSKGEKVFLKHYKSPTVSSGKTTSGGRAWFDDYYKYEIEKNRRIDDSAAKDFCISTLDIFKVGYPRSSSKENMFQVYKYEEVGGDLRKILEKMEVQLLKGKKEWEKRMLIAKVMVAAICFIHQIKLVHGDLKPENVFLIEDPGTRVGYQTRLIDMDGSVLTDIKAPWHDDETKGYLGTINYHSPEHLTGKVPEPASDVFTCSLILYELLTGEHPFESSSPEEYLSKIRKGNPPLPNLYGKINSANLNATDELARTMRDALSFDPSKRPDAQTLRLALLGRRPRMESDSSTPPSVIPNPAKPVEPPPVITKSKKITLSNESGFVEFKSSILVGPPELSQLGNETKYMSKPQFALKYVEEEWFVEPRKSSHSTLLNQNTVTESTQLKTGDRLCVGNAEKKVYVLPMKVEILDA